MSTQENPNGSTASRENQATLGDFRETSPELYPDGYGPTMNRPVPREERADLEDGADSRELEATGLAPADLSFVSRYDSGPERVRKVASGQYPPFHPDDETRPDRREEEAEILRSGTVDEPDPDAGGETAVADGGTVVKYDDDPEPGDDVLLIEDPAGGLNTAPNLVEGAVSSSGKTVILPESETLREQTYYLDAETLFAGEREIRKSTSYRLYTPERFQSTQRANYGPGAQAGSNGETSVAELPEPTHRPSENPV